MSTIYVVRQGVDMPHDIDTRHKDSSFFRVPGTQRAERLITYR